MSTIWDSMMLEERNTITKLDESRREVETSAGRAIRSDKARLDRKLERISTKGNLY